MSEEMDKGPRPRSEPVKKMDLKEFWESGLMQEVNRRFFHPLGLALEMVFDKETMRPVCFGGVWDYRDDPEGITFAPPRDYADALEMHEKCRKVEQMRQAHRAARCKMFGNGSEVQPLPGLEK